MEAEKKLIDFNSALTTIEINEKYIFKGRNFLEIVHLTIPYFIIAKQY